MSRLPNERGRNNRLFTGKITYYKHTNTILAEYYHPDGKKRLGEEGKRTKTFWPAGISCGLKGLLGTAYRSRWC